MVYKEVENKCAKLCNAHCPEVRGRKFILMSFGEVSNAAKTPRCGYLD